MVSRHAIKSSATFCTATCCTRQPVFTSLLPHLAPVLNPSLSISLSLSPPTDERHGPDGGRPQERAGGGADAGAGAVQCSTRGGHTHCRERERGAGGGHGGSAAGPLRRLWLFPAVNARLVVCSSCPPACLPQVRHAGTWAQSNLSAYQAKEAGLRGQVRRRRTARGCPHPAPPCHALHNCTRGARAACSCFAPSIWLPAWPLSIVPSAGDLGARAARLFPPGLAGGGPGGLGARGGRAAHREALPHLMRMPALPLWCEDGG